MKIGMGEPELLTVLVLIVLILTVIVVHLCLDINKRVGRVASLFNYITEAFIILLMTGSTRTR